MEGLWYAASHAYYWMLWDVTRKVGNFYLRSEILTEQILSLCGLRHTRVSDFVKCLVQLLKTLWMNCSLKH